MNTPDQKPPVTAVAVERALDQLLPRLPFWARRQAQRQLGLGRDPQACVLRACLCAFLQNEFDCSNLLGIYPEEIWIQGESRPRKITPPTWASALIRGLDEMKQAGEPITGTDVLLLLSRLGLLVVCNGEMWDRECLHPRSCEKMGTQDRIGSTGQGKARAHRVWPGRSPLCPGPVNQSNPKETGRPRSPGRNAIPMAHQLPLFLQGPTTFHIAARVKAEALVLLQTYFNEKVLPDLDEDDEETRRPFVSLEEALFTLGWEATGDAEGNIVFLSFTDRFLSKQDEVLATLAPRVTVGSSLLVVIEKPGQYGFGVEGWFFDGTRMHREQALISFPRSLVDTLLRRS